MANQETSSAAYRGEQVGQEYPDTLVQDPEKAHAMALASNRNELNRIAFKAIALEHMENPASKKSPLRAHISRIKGAEFSSTDPSVRVVQTKQGGYAYEHTAESAIAEARKERDEADRVAQIAADRYDALEKL